MKKLWYALGSIGTMIAPIVGIAACSSAKMTKVTWKSIEAPFKGRIIADNAKIAAVVSDPENPRWQKAKYQLKAAGLDQGFNITTNILKKQTAQNEWIKTQINQSIKGLIVGATDDGISRSLTAAATAKIPVVAYDRLIKTKTATYNWYVTFDNALVGQLQGLSILSNLYHHPFLKVAEIATYVKSHPLKLKTDFLTIGGDPADNNAHLFWQGGHDVLKMAMDADANLQELTPDTFAAVAQKNWDYAKGKAFFDAQLSKLTALERQRSLKAILAPNDGMATGAAIPALRKYHLDPQTIYITGQDSNDQSIISIAKGQGQNMTIYKPDALAARMAIAILNELISKPTATTQEVETFLKEAYPKIAFKLDLAQYKVKPNGKIIKTILLTPQVVTKANYTNFFSVS